MPLLFKSALFLLISLIAICSYHTSFKPIRGRYAAHNEYYVKHTAQSQFTRIRNIVTPHTETNELTSTFVEFIDLKESNETEISLSSVSSTLAEFDSAASIETQTLTNPSILAMNKDNSTEASSYRIPWENVYTFYEHCGGFGSGKKLLQIWLRSWYAAGFHPRIFRLKNAEQHPRYAELRDHFAAYPTVNPPQYELYCYLRWLAYEMTNGGIFVDYDIFPIKEDLLRSELQNITAKEQDHIASWMHLAPMGTVAGPKGISRFVALLTSHSEPQDVIGGKPHSSDMHIARNNFKFYSKLMTTDSGMFHASHNWMYRSGVSKSREEATLDLLRVSSLNSRNYIILLTPGIRIKSGLVNLSTNGEDLERTKLRRVAESVVDIDLMAKTIVFVTIRSGEEGPNSIANLDAKTRSFLQKKNKTCKIVPIMLGQMTESNLLLEFTLGYQLTEDFSFTQDKIDEVREKDLLTEGTRIYNDLHESFIRDFLRVSEMEDQASQV